MGGEPREKDGAEQAGPDHFLFEEGERVYFVFEEGDLTLALPPQVVSEVTGFSPPTPVPFTPDWIEGVISVRGQIVPVLDLGLFFGLSGAQRDAHRRILVVDNGEHQFAVWADRIHGVEGVSEATLEQPLESIPKELLDCSLGQFRQMDRLVIALDLERLVARTRAQVHEG